jgi:hypothetical protein
VQLAHVIPEIRSRCSGRTIRLAFRFTGFTIQNRSQPIYRLLSQHQHRYNLDYSRCNRSPQAERRLEQRCESIGARGSVGNERAVLGELLLHSFAVFVIVSSALPLRFEQQGGRDEAGWTGYDGEGLNWVILWRSSPCIQPLLCLSCDASMNLGNHGTTIPSRSLHFLAVSCSSLTTRSTYPIGTANPWKTGGTWIIWRSVHHPKPLDHCGLALYRLFASLMFAQIARHRQSTDVESISP